MTTKLERLEQDYYQQQTELNRILTQDKKDEKRLRFIVGKAVLDNLISIEEKVLYDQNEDYLVSILNKFVTHPDQRKFLEQQGFSGRKG